MRFPVWFENFQIKYMNPAIRPMANYLPGMSVIKHRGRTSGKQYETVVSAYRKGDTLAILLAHGKTNWVKNILAAGEADIRLGRHDLHLVNPRLVTAGTDDSSLPGIARSSVKRGVGAFVADIA
jgi:deazaflavin-dependent oxidoreductase (nitroreductase family)